MAVSGKTSDFEIPYLTEEDGPDMGAGDKAIAERVNAILKSIKGDATLATNGTLTVGSNGKSLYIAGATERTSAAFGSFGTPLKVTLPNVRAKQIIEILAFGWGSATIESKQTEEPGGYFALQVGGVTIAEAKLSNSAHAVASGSFRQVATSPYAGLQILYPGAGTANTETDYEIGSARTTVERLGFGAISPFARPTQFMANAEVTNLIVEIVGRSTSGTVKLTNGILLARPVG